MKSLFRWSILTIMKRLARLRLRLHHPFTIGVTGSVGKTSTKAAIATVLGQKYKVTASTGGYNSEFGITLTILEEKSGFSSAKKWAGVIWRSLKKILQRKPLDAEILVLEMGADKPGDINRLAQLAGLNIAVLTNIKEVHMAEGQFADREAIFQEKTSILNGLSEDGWLIVNYDDLYLRRLIQANLPMKVITYGTDHRADLRARAIQQTPTGITFTLLYDDKETQINVPILGKHQIYVVLPAIACGFLKGMKIHDIAMALAAYRLPQGRMNPIEGIRGSMIIDSSYNASPETMRAALEVLKEMPGRRIAVLGTMNELGANADKEHWRLGRIVPGCADFLVTVGDRAALASSEALKNGVQTAHFLDSISAAEFLSREIREGDVILVKGSQNAVRLERLVKAIMRDPERAKELLVRQDDEWEKIA